MKVTAKTTKEMMKEFLEANSTAVAEVNKDLHSRTVYALKMLNTDESKVARKDLADLVKETTKVLGKKAVEPTKEVKAEEPKAEPKAENSVKFKGGKKKADEKEETPKEEPKTEAPKTEVEKKKSTKNSKKEDEAKMFPNTIKVAEVEYEICHDIKNMDDFYEALSDEENDIILAFHWTKKDLKQWQYFNGLLGQPKSFKDDLDLADVGYISDEKKVAYALSKYTEAFYTIVPNFFEEVDGIKYASGIEFEIYKAV